MYICVLLLQQLIKYLHVNTQTTISSLCKYGCIHLPYISLILWKTLTDYLYLPNNCICYLRRVNDYKSLNKQVLYAQCLAYALVKERNCLDCRVNIQGIINSTETETFAKAPKLVKLLRELKSTPMQCHKKSTGSSGMFVALNLLRFGALLRDNM